MRTIALSLVALGLAVAAKAPETPYTTLAQLASDLSQSDAAGAIAVFDSSMKGYGALRQNIDSLVAQTTIASAIDVVEDTEKDGIHELTLDWYVTVTLQSDTTRVERRREQVSIGMRQIKGKWKITSMSPLSILDPINII